jgi:hypothetical protein
MLANCAQPASRTDLFNPALAAAPLGRNAPGFSGSGLGSGRLVIPAVFKFSSAIASHWLTSLRAVLWWKSLRRWRTSRHCRASARRSRLRFPAPGLVRALRRSRSTITSADAARKMLPLELERLNGAGNGPVLADLNGSDRLEPRLGPLPVAARLPLRAVPSDEHDLAEPLVRLEPRAARFFPSRRRLRGPEPVKERSEYRAEPTEGLLLCCERVQPLAVRVGAAGPPAVASGRRGTCRLFSPAPGPCSRCGKPPRRLSPCGATCTPIVWPGTDISGQAR